MRNKLLCIQSGWVAAPVPVWKSERLWSIFLLAAFKVMLSGGEEAQDTNGPRLLEKWWFNLESNMSANEGYRQK